MRLLKKGTPAVAIIFMMSVLPLFGALQSGARIVFGLRVYQPVGASQVDWLEMKPPARQTTNVSETEKNQCRENPREPSAEARARAESSMAGNGRLPAWSPDGSMYAFVARNPAVPPPTPNPWSCADCFYPDLKIARATDNTVVATIRLPERSEHWNYPQSITWSPDGRMLLVGAEAGSSDSHFADYWLLDRSNQSWRYAGGGNDAKWSPDSSRILWATPRRLEPLGKLHVWVVHLTMLDVQTLKQEALTSGTSYVSEFYWCAK